jgi:hypothetical protein
MTLTEKVKNHTKDFWKYASRTEGIADIEDVFVDWAEKADITISDFFHVWASIHEDINNAFGIKTADVSFSGNPDDLTKLLRQLYSQGEIGENNNLTTPIEDSSITKPPMTPINPSPELMETPKPTEPMKDLGTAPSSMASPEPKEAPKPAGEMTPEGKKDLPLVGSLEQLVHI